VVRWIEVFDESLAGVEKLGKHRTVWPRPGYWRVVLIE
jgi:hypothetical protein